MVRLEFDIPDYMGGLAFGFGAGVRRQIVLTLANAHVRAVEDKAKANAPVKSKTLKNSIRAKLVGERRGVLIAEAPYAKYLHEGTGIYGPRRRPIVIEPKGKKALHWPGAGHPVKRVRQKGIKPHDFLRLAMQQSRAEMQARLAVAVAMNQAALANTGGGDSPSNVVDPVGVVIVPKHPADGCPINVLCIDPGPFSMPYQHEPFFDSFGRPGAGYKPSPEVMKDWGDYIRDNIERALEREKKRDSSGSNENETGGGDGSSHIRFQDYP